MKKKQTHTTSLLRLNVALNQLSAAKREKLLHCQMSIVIFHLCLSRRMKKIRNKNRQKTGNSPRAKPYMEALKSTQAKLSPKEEEFNHCVRRSFAHLNRATARDNSGGISGDALLRLGGRNWTDQPN